jgi:hypothetical protein
MDPIWRPSSIVALPEQRYDDPFKRGDAHPPCTAGEDEFFLRMREEMNEVDSPLRRQRLAERDMRLHLAD